MQNITHSRVTNQRFIMLSKKWKNNLFFSIILLLFFGVQSSFSQVTIFSEDFEAASGNENQATPYLSWQTGQFNTTPPTNDNYWWVFDNTRCTVINGNYSMAVSQNTPATTGPLPQYRSNRVASTLVYYTTPINATNYTNLTLDFNWICEGEIGFDYGTVLYSLDGGTWAALPGFYEGQSTVQNVVNLDLSIVDGQSFYIGFGWDNDSSVGNAPSFTVDDIVIKGTLLPTCSTPTAQPTSLSLSATGDSINGSFNAASPTPDNYLVVISTSATAPNPVNGTNYNIGDSIGTGTVVDVDNNTVFTATGLNASTTYYIYVFSYNGNCVGGPLYNISNPLNGNLTTSNTVYCSALTTNTASAKYINDVEFIGTLNDVQNFTNSYSTSPNGYQDWTGITNAIQAQGEGINVYVGSSTGRGHYKAWVDWNKDGDFTDVGELVYDTGGIATTTTTFGYTIPANQVIGDYRLRIRFFNSFRSQGPFTYEYAAYDFTPCETFNTVPVGNNTYTAYGETEDYLFTVIENCPARITSITDGVTCGEGTVDLNVTGAAGVTEFRWYDAETGGNLLATTTSGTWSPFISTTTTFWVTAYDGNCESVKRLKILGFVNPITTLTFNPENPTVCGLNDIIEISATGETEIAYLIDEDFEGGGLGVFTRQTYITNQNAITQWQNQTSTHVPSLQVWEPAISSGFGANHFVMATSDVPTSTETHNAIISPVINTSTFTDLTLNFDMYFSRYLFTPSIPENVNIDISTDGGTNWTTVQTYDDDIGYGTSFSNLTVDLSAYINQTNLRMRIRYYANYWCDGVAVDNIQVYGTRPLNPSFTWSGSPAVDAYTDAAATTPYVPGTAVSTVYVKPTLSQLELAQFTFTATATLSNGCDIIKDITITNNTKVWQGLSSNWNVNNNWKPSGVPNSTNCVVIPSKPNDAEINGTTDANAYNLTVLNGGVLSVFPGGTITVQDYVDVNAGGTFELQSANGAADGSTSSLSGSLIQVNDVSNTGTITFSRRAFVRTQDYVYWSTPVENFPLSGISSTTHKYKWIPTVPANTPTGYGEWQQTSENMISGKGYIVRGPNGNGNSSTIATWNTVTFFGVPNNGTITLPIERGSYTTPGAVGNPNPNQADITEDDDNWNLVGNPYPSTLDADAFLTLNSQTNSRIIGTLWLWQHGIQIRRGNSPFFGEYVFNYDSADYLEYNLSGSTGGFSGYIGSGQGFFVLMDDASASGSTIEYNNTMRGSSFDSNAQFFRNSDLTETQVREKHRIWLDFINTSTDKISTILFGYIEDATDDYDKLFDAPLISGSSKKIFMPNEAHDKNYVIQGRALPFDNSDIIALNVITEVSQNYAIALHNFDGLFETENQNIYLEDLSLGIIHNLKDAPYLFTSNESGVIENRFVIRFTESSLGTDKFDFNNLTISAPNSDFIKVVSNNGLLSQVTVYDLLGRELVNELNINTEEIIINNIPSAAGTYIVKARLLNGNEKIQKVVLK